MRRRQLDEMIPQIYESGADLNRGLDNCLELIGDAVGARISSLSLRSKEPSVIERSVHSGGFSLETARDYNARQLWRLRSNFENQPGAPILIENLARSRNPLVAGKYANYLASLGEARWLSMKICTIDDVDFVITSTRPHEDSPFTFREASMFAALCPHLATALNLRSRALFRNQIMSAYSGVADRFNVGIIVIDIKGHIVEMNATAEQLVKNGDWLLMFNRTIHASIHAEDTKLQRMIRSAISNEANEANDCTTDHREQAMVVSSHSSQRDLGLVVESLHETNSPSLMSRRGAKIMFRIPVSAPGPSPNRLRELYGFTSAEANLAIEMVKGLSIEQLCKRFSIRRNTARAHLRSMFSKAKASRQSEFVAKILNGIGAIGDEHNDLPHA